MLNAADSPTPTPDPQAATDPFPADPLEPANFPERVVWASIAWMYLWFILGAQYVVGAVLGWILALYLALKLWIQTPETPAPERLRIPWLVWVWIGGMLVQQVALIVGHLDFDLGTGQLIKSSIGWAKGWALMALYPLAGSLPIRPALIYRAVCVVCWHSLLLAPLFLVAPSLHLPEILYVSPLKAVGGPGPMFFDVPLYEIDGSTGDLRWRLFTPWGPALGFVGNVFFILALEETDRKWKWRGLAGAVLLCLICKSRLAQICLVIVPLLTWILSRLARPWMLMGVGTGSVLAGLLSPTLIAAFDAFWDRFKSARAGSTRVRFALKRIAEHRWRTEAPIWGHGVVEKGPHLVEAMPIGSHHTWYGLLFVKGIVGLMALLVPMVVSFLVLWLKSLNPRNPSAKVALSMVMILFLYTFGENLEILAYLFWPGLVMIGIGCKDQSQPRHSKLRRPQLPQPDPSISQPDPTI